METTARTGIWRYVELQWSAKLEDQSQGWGARCKHPLVNEHVRSFAQQRIRSFETEEMYGRKERRALDGEWLLDHRLWHVKLEYLSRVKEAVTEVRFTSPGILNLPVV